MNEQSLCFGTAVGPRPQALTASFCRSHTNEINSVYLGIINLSTAGVREAQLILTMAVRNTATDGAAKLFQCSPVICDENQALNLRLIIHSLPCLLYCRIKGETAVLISRKA